MLEYTTLNSKGVKLGDTVPLGQGASTVVEILAGSRRKDRFSIDASGVVACTVGRDQYGREAAPPEVRLFNSERTLISDWIAPGQRVRYMRVVAADKARKLDDTIAVGFEVYRHPVPVAESVS